MEDALRILTAGDGGIFVTLGGRVCEAAAAAAAAADADAFD